MGKKLYLAVTADKYELPVAVTDNVGDMAKAFRMSKRSLLSSLTRGNRKKIGPKEYVRFVSITLDEGTVECKQSRKKKEQ